MRSESLKNIEAFARNIVRKYDPAHDWWHVERVRNLSVLINIEEKIADPVIVEAVALLHDAADSKFNSNIKEAFAKIEACLDENGFSEEKEHITEIISNISFSNKERSGNLKDPVLFIVQDADRLDAIGAIGIARAFAYSGHKSQPLFDPEGNTPSAIDHFNEKLLLLAEMLNTATARSIARERHNFMLSYVKQFNSEWRFAFNNY